MDFESKFPTTISLRAETGVDGFKVKTFGSATTATARVKKDRKHLGTEGGTENADKATIWTQEDIAHTTLIWFAGESTTDASTGRRWKEKESFESIDGDETFYQYKLE